MAKFIKVYNRPDPNYAHSKDVAYGDVFVNVDNIVYFGKIGLRGRTLIVLVDGSRIHAYDFNEDILL